MMTAPETTRSTVFLLAVPFLLLAVAAYTDGGVRGLSVVFSGELNGYIAPCGCAKPMLGGMERRGALLARLRRTSSVVLVENGDLTGGSGRQDELKAETLVEMLSALRYDAFCPGEKDLALGLASVMRLQARAQFPFVAANVTDAAGNPVFREHVTVTRTLGPRRVRVAITGLLSPAAAASENLPLDEFRIGKPEDVLPAVLRHTRTARLRLLLYHGARHEAERLARRFPGFALVVCSHTSDGPVPPSFAGKTAVVSAGSRGKHLGRLELRASRGDVALAREIRWYALGEAIGTDESITRLRRRYLARVTEENLLAALPRRPQPEGQAYAGSAACQPCHEEAYRIWERSRHARAFATLARLGEDRDPECVACHVTGLDVEGGYAPGSKRLAYVGCESCHGMAAAHAESGGEPLPPRGGPKACGRCHVPDHSPAFRFSTYWPTIRH